MNNLKGFYIKNKQLIMLTASVVIGIFLIFTVIAVVVNNNGKSSSGGTIKKTTEQETTTLSAESEENTTEEETAAKQDETTKEPETEPETADPYSLPYMIKVNRAANCITVYSKDTSGHFSVPVKAITCSTGKNVGDTPAGTFTTLVSYKWLLMVDGSYGQYAYRFYGPILFHSVPYYSKNKGDLEWEQYNKLGEAASLGCVRVTVADAIWLIDNCPVGTLVEVYDDADNPGPLGKPETIKIPSDSPYRGWDPTDPDENNPWHKFKPEIKVQSTNVTIEKGSTIEQLVSKLGAKAYDTCGNDITSKLKAEGVNFNAVGTYGNVKLNVTDAIGKSADEVTVHVTVKEKEETTETSQKVTEESTEEETTTKPEESQSTSEDLTQDATGEGGETIGEDNINTTEENTSTSQGENQTENKTTHYQDEASTEEGSQTEENTRVYNSGGEGEEN